jgi:hypothetical protein
MQDLAQNVLSIDYANKESEGLEIFQEVNGFIEKHFKETGGPAEVEVYFIFSIINQENILTGSFRFRLLQLRN